MSTLLKILPASVIRFAGRIQFKLPFLRGPLNFIAQRLSGDGVIQRGAGQGLFFDARGCNPGYLAGTSQPLEQELLMRYSPPGGVVYDLGANAGYYAVIAARAVGVDGKVYAFEPTPALAKRIQSNAARNNLSNLEVIEAAVCGKDGNVKFGIVGEVEGSVNNSLKGAQTGDAIEVKAIRLDTFCRDHRLPDLILIDIEGAEIEALAGALGILRDKQPVIMVEVHWLGSTFFEFLKDVLAPLGYTASTYDGRPLPEGNVRYHALLLPTIHQIR